MVDKFDLQNMTTLKKVSFGQNFGYDYIYKDGDIDWGVAPGQHNTYSYPGQIGVSISNSMIKERDISISGYVYYVPTIQDKAEFPNRNELTNYVYSKIRERKDILNDMINPLEVIRIYVGDYYIEGNPTQSIQYGKTIQDNNEVFCRFLINLYCNEPGFKKDTVRIENERSITGLFHFPLVLSKTIPTVMSYRVDYNTLKVNNEGGITIGGKVILLARSEIVNPVIINTTTGERMKINKTMLPGERIEITTTDGNNKGVKGFVEGVEYNYLKYWNFENDWIKFKQGSTLLSYYTDNESENFLDVSVELNPEKLALEDM